MKDWRTASTGNFVKWRGIVWVIRNNRNGVLVLDELEGEDTRKLSVADWQQGIFDEKIHMLERPVEGLPEDRQGLDELQFEALPPSMQAAVLRKRRYIEAYLDPASFYATYLPGVPRDKQLAPTHMSEAKVMPLLKAVSDSFKPRDRAPGFTTFAGWMRDWERYRSWVLMAPRYDKRGSDERTVIVGPLKRIVDAAIKQIWMTQSQETKTAVCEEVDLQVLRYNKRHPKKHIGVSRRQIYNYMDQSIDKYEAALARKGREWADRHFKPVGVGPGADRVMEVVEVDHTQAKVEVADDVTGKNLGRPWITAALDRRSRMPVGIHVHFEGQSLYAVMQALRNAMMPKRFLRTLLPELDYDYPCCGTPEVFFFDRGKDFDNDYIDEVGLNLDIKLRYAPGEHPEYKASLERFFGTGHKQVALPLKGAMPRVNAATEDRRPKTSEATVSFSDFYARLWRWIATVYARDFHEGLDGIPLEMWNESAEVRAPRPPPSKRKLDTYLLRAVRCTPTKEGVQYSGLRWNGDIIQAIRSQPGPTPSVLVRMDDGDVSRAFVTDPVTGNNTALEPVLRKYMPGLTLHQHELVLRMVAKKRKGAQSERDLLEAKARLRKEALESHTMKSVSSKTRARIARALNIGAVAPVDDDLGSLDPRQGTTAAPDPADGVVEAMTPAAIASVKPPEPEAEDVPSPDVAQSRPGRRVSKPRRKLSELSKEAE